MPSQNNYILQSGRVLTRLQERYEVQLETLEEYRRLWEYVASDQWPDWVKNTKEKEPVPEVKWDKCEVSEGYALIDGQLRKVK